MSGARLLLIAPFWPSQTWFSVVGMAHTGPRAVIDDLPDEVQETIASARAPPLLGSCTLPSGASLNPGV